MKKVSSAALLALKLSWKAVFAVLVTGAAVQLFSVWRWLMPGGIPIQNPYGFSELIHQAVADAGMLWMLPLLIVLVLRPASSRGSKTVYTMNRLGLSELQMTLVFGGVFTGYFLLYWALQFLLVYGFFAWYSRFTLVSSNAFMLTCWDSDWLHTLLPLAEWWNYIRNLVICLSFGFSAAIGSTLSRRGRFPLASLIPVPLCKVLLSRTLGDVFNDAALTLLLAGFTVGYCFYLKEGIKDEDL